MGRSRRLSVVLTRDEVRIVLEHLDGTPRLMATLLYGAGLRLLEGVQLRVKEVDFASNQILVRVRPPTGREGGHPPSGPDQTSVLPHVPALLRNPFA
ncbi:MAG: tyrosine-type recombinase/integrase [candidate division NC10 bacterium]|nr:tyrosine-type recombinase/integrase [candidate division NC10 bacterium]